MLVLPILIHANKDSHAKICNVEVKYKDASKVKKNTTLRGFGASDIIVNGTNFNHSFYDTANKKPNTVVNFIRNHSMKSDKKRFLISTRMYSNSSLFDIYSVEIPPKKVSAGLDNLLGSTILDMQKEIPNITYGRDIDLQQLEVDANVTDEKLGKLRYIVENVEDKTKWEYLFAANGVSDLKQTLDFMNLFDFSIISEATLSKKEVDSILDSFSYIYTQEYKQLKKYYDKALHNRDVFRKLNTVSQLIYEKPIHLIHQRKDEKVLTIRKNDSIREKNAA